MLNSTEVITAFKNVAVKELSNGGATKIAIASLPFIYSGALIGLEILLCYGIYRSSKEIIAEIKRRRK